MKRLVISVCLSLLIFLACGNTKSKPIQANLIWGEWELKGSEGYINIRRSKNYYGIIAGDALNCFIVTGMSGEYPDCVLSIKFRSGVQSPNDNGFADRGELIVHFIDENKMWIEDKFNTELEGMIHWYNKNNLSIWIITGKENIYQRIRERNE